jgi:hypothetical protein
MEASYGLPPMPPMPPMVEPDQCFEWRWCLRFEWVWRRLLIGLRARAQEIMMERVDCDCCTMA